MAGETRTENPDGTYTITYPSGKKIMYEKDGRPCRSCNTLLDFRSVNMMKKTGSSFNQAATAVGGSGAAAGAGAAAVAAVAVAATKATSDDAYAKDCPPDVTQLGNGTWSLLHSIAAKYPETPTDAQQKDLKNFVGILSRIYPCWFCADDFKKYIAKNEVKVKSQDDFGKWLCDAHNSVNVKLGKPKFDCNLWKERWKDGWKDGSCD
ncbi:flavin-linked sulfhydryl oxidase [Saccharomycopsis crataegensis]|uniref:Sulfhydryl oxidase n=1 Tax=Saccharomycopsis crataegensis TaxID=43959 RepID=A0AAV5QPL1_9ASCO|nr:flavin-linked sulfhydryl oxidase [Saccharomycopsis crataegensis]